MFNNIRWSSEATFFDQVTAIGVEGIPVRVGASFHDIDEPEDLRGLHERLKENQGASAPRLFNVLERLYESAKLGAPLLRCFGVGLGAGSGSGLRSSVVIASTVVSSLSGAFLCLAITGQLTKVLLAPARALLTGGARTGR